MAKSADSPTRDELAAATDDELMDYVDAWADEWAASADVAYALAGRDLVYEVIKRWRRDG